MPKNSVYGLENISNQKIFFNEVKNWKLLMEEGTMYLCEALWAKKDNNQGNGQWLPLLQHLEDTSWVCGFFGYLKK